jgi:hypothetical protein
MKEIKYKILCCAIPFYYGSVTIINYDSGSAKSVTKLRAKLWLLRFRFGLRHRLKDLPLDN